MNKQSLISLVLESNNLRGGEASSEMVVTSLIDVLRNLSKQTYSIDQLDKLIVTHDGLSQIDLDQIREVISLPQLEFVEISEQDGYYKAKNIGFEHTTSDVVVFADADCTPKANWLERLVEPYLTAQQEQAELPPVVAGRTTYHDSVLGSAISTMDFIYFKSPLQKGAVRNFYANNVAFRRDIYQKYHFEQHQEIFRGHCQLVGMALTKDGIPIHFQPSAHTIHRFPDTAKELLKLRLLRGQDTVSLAPHLVEAALPASMYWMKKILPVNLLMIFLIRPITGVLQINKQDMKKLSGLRYLACMANIAAVNAVDASGAFLRLIGLSPLGKVKDGELMSMSYHADRA
jgi:hypothetical protein